MRAGLYPCRVRASVEQIRRVAERFAVPGTVAAVARHGQGLIHDSFAVTFTTGQGARRILVQRMNRAVFSDPLAVLGNVARVTEHLRAKLRARSVAELERRVLTLVAADDGGPCVYDERGEVYRAYLFVERAHAVSGPPSVEHARQAGFAFGEYQALLADLPLETLVETIPGFHDTAARLVALTRAAEQDLHGRAAGAGPELAFIEARAALVQRFTDAIARGDLERRVVHNDTKLDNLLFDDATGEALCVVDLDTTMPGVSAHDFGDLARSLASAHGGSALPLPLLHAAADGYRSAVGPLTAAERELLPEAPRLIALELGARFLADYLQGDRYFTVSEPGQNLARAREQLRLVLALEDHALELQACFRSA